MSLSKKYIKKAKEVLELEAKAIRDLIPRIGKEFLKAVELIYTAKGRVIISGVGKAGIIAQKISATLSSTGTPSIWVHSGEAIHGDLGRITKKDVVVILSNSGESDEVIKLLPVLKRIGTKIIAITGRPQSTLARHSDVVLDVSVEREACPLNLAPTTSTTAMLAMGDAIAVCLIELRNFKHDDFALYHPGGSLGRRLLLKVKDIMRTGDRCPLVGPETLVKDVLLRITSAKAGAAIIVDKRGKLSGIFTDGDLRRHIETNADILSLPIRKVMTKTPISVHEDTLAFDAMQLLKEKKIDEVPVINSRGRVVGLLDIQDLISAGL